MNSITLVISLHNEDQLPDVVRQELIQLTAAIQTWADKSQLGIGNIRLDGMATFLGQPRCKIFKRVAQSIANDTDTIVSWDTARSNAPLEEYDDYGMFDGSKYIVCKEAGLYIAHAELQWGASAVGIRAISIHPRTSLIDTLAQDRKDGSASSGGRQNVISVFPVISPAMDNVGTPFPLGIGVNVYQNSGGALNIGGIGNERFGVWKIG